MAGVDSLEVFAPPLRQVAGAAIASRAGRRSSPVTFPTKGDAGRWLASVETDRTVDCGWTPERAGCDWRITRRIG